MGGFYLKEMLQAQKQRGKAPSDRDWAACRESGTPRLGNTRVRLGSTGKVPAPFLVYPLAEPFP